MSCLYINHPSHIRSFYTVIHSYIRWLVICNRQCYTYLIAALNFLTDDLCMNEWLYGVSEWVYNRIQYNFLVEHVYERISLTNKLFTIHTLIKNTILQYKSALDYYLLWNDSECRVFCGFIWKQPRRRPKCQLKLYCKKTFSFVQ